MLSQNTIITNSKFQAVLGMRSLTCVVDLIQFQMFKTTFNLLLKSMTPLQQMKILQY